MAKRAEYGKNKQICVISISRRTRLKFTSLFSATFLFSLLVPMRQYYLFAYDIDPAEAAVILQNAFMQPALALPETACCARITASANAAPPLSRETKPTKPRQPLKRHGGRNWASRKPYRCTPTQAKNLARAMLPPTANVSTWAKACIWTANGCNREKKSTAAVRAAP